MQIGHTFGRRVWRPTDAVEIADDAWSHSEPTEHQELAILEIYLEPISKLFEAYGAESELHKPEEIGGVILPANEAASLPLQPGKETFDEPATFIPA